jgi:hypothetical protein
MHTLMTICMQLHHRYTRTFAPVTLCWTSNTVCLQLMCCVVAFSFSNHLYLLLKFSAPVAKSDAVRGLLATLSTQTTGGSVTDSARHPGTSALRLWKELSKTARVKTEASTLATCGAMSLVMTER